MGLNFLAIIVVTVLSMVIGGFWYSPALFGKQWMLLSRVSKKTVEHSNVWQTYAISLIVTFVMAYVVALFVDYAAARTLASGLLIGFLFWAGLVATTMINPVLWEKRPFRLFLINVSHYLVVLLLMGAVLAVWQ